VYACRTFITGAAYKTITFQDVTAAQSLRITTIFISSSPALGVGSARPQEWEFMEPTDRSKYDPRIDIVRACAFLMVAIVHFSVTQWTDSIPDHHLVIDTVALGLIHTGWLGVPLFLFVSGYSLGLGKTGPNYVLDVKQFFVNRVLRIFPIWIVCVLCMAFTQKLSGINVFTLLLLQTQDVPANTAFGLAWSLQLEFTCYLFFPLLLVAVATSRKMLLLYYALFFVFRLNVWYSPAAVLWGMSYDTVFGEGTIFLTGIFTASLAPITDRTKARLYLWSGLAVFCVIAVFVWKSGGYQNPSGLWIGRFFLVMPEVLAITFFVMLRGWLAKVATEPRRVSTGQKIRSFAFKAFTHLGKVSYSAYLFSLHVIWFWTYTFPFMKPGGWHELIPACLSYLLCVWGFATITYNTIELPFLNMRKKYVRPPERPAPAVDGVAGYNRDVPEFAATDPHRKAAYSG
jgi:peptidoglycan/LPS O-acetylase OafA/YrhL